MDETRANRIISRSIQDKKKATSDLRLERFCKNINIKNELYFRFKITSQKAAIERQSRISLGTIFVLKLTDIISLIQ